MEVTVMKEAICLVLGSVPTYINVQGRCSLFFVTGIIIHTSVTKCHERTQLSSEMILQVNRTYKSLHPPYADLSLQPPMLGVDIINPPLNHNPIMMTHRTRTNRSRRSAPPYHPHLLTHASPHDLMRKRQHIGPEGEVQFTRRDSREAWGVVEFDDDGACVDDKGGGHLVGS